MARSTAGSLMPRRRKPSRNCMRPTLSSPGGCLGTPSLPPDLSRKTGLQPDSAGQAHASRPFDAITAAVWNQRIACGCIWRRRDGRIPRSRVAARRTRNRHDADCVSAGCRRPRAGRSLDFALASLLAGWTAVAISGFQRDVSIGGRRMTSATQAQSAPAKRILVVEDELMIRMLLEDMLGELGYTVAAEAARIEEALDAAKTADFDIAILDVNLNGQPISPVADALVARGMPSSSPPATANAACPNRIATGRR